eukprot:PhM_4_TR9361/c0_g1_i1/m.14252
MRRTLLGRFPSTPQVPKRTTKTTTRASLLLLQQHQKQPTLLPSLCKHNNNITFSSHSSSSCLLFLHSRRNYCTWSRSTNSKSTMNYHMEGEGGNNNDDSTEHTVRIPKKDSKNKNDIKDRIANQEKLSAALGALPQPEGSNNVELFFDNRAKTSDKIDPIANEIYAGAVATRAIQGIRKHPSLNCVVGGADTIRAIWKKHKVRPHAVFVPDDVDVPQWCRESATDPTYIVRCPVPLTNRTIVRGELNDGFAAHFPTPQVPSELDLVEPSPDVKFGRILVMHGISIPANAGMLLRAARQNEFDAVIMHQCCVPTSERVMRASGGATFDPKLRVYDLGVKSEADAASMLQHVAFAHKCRPVFSLPTKEAVPITEYARARYANQSPHGVMLFVGGEHHGLENLRMNWTAVQPDWVTLQMDNPMVESLNVVVAGSILMHQLRPKADREHAACAERGIRMVTADVDVLSE